jgi:hypothetical protein
MGAAQGCSASKKVRASGSPSHTRRIAEYQRTPDFGGKIDMDAATVVAVFKENKQKISDDLASRCMSCAILLQRPRSSAPWLRGCPKFDRSRTVHVPANASNRCSHHYRLRGQSRRPEQQVGGLPDQSEHRGNDRSGAHLRRAWAFATVRIRNAALGRLDCSNRLSGSGVRAHCSRARRLTWFCSISIGCSSKLPHRRRRGMLYRANSGTRLVNWSSRRKRAAQVSCLSTIPLRVRP